MTTPARWTQWSRACAAAVVVLLAGSAIPAQAATLTATPTSAPTSAPTVTPTATPTTTTVAGTGRVIEAGGVRQWISCTGTGQPTVVVVTGLGTPSSAWSQVAPDFAATTRTCLVDRPGLGSSPAPARVGMVVDAGRQARQLGALLRAAGESGPYLVVGHSYGGLIARAFARQQPDAVAAVMLVEGVDPHGTSSRYWTEAGQRIDMARSRAAAGGGPDLGDRPLIVVAASQPDRDHLVGPAYGESAAAIREWKAQQRAAVRASRNALWVEATSGHVVQQDDPGAVIVGLRALVSAVRDGGRLTCTSVWRAVAARC